MAKTITYLVRTLSADESITSVAEIHWMAYVAPWILIIFGFFLIFPILIGILMILSFWKTEMVCTNKRVIYKTGIIAVKTQELRNAKVESISIQQSLFGRMFGYADIVFCGSGNTNIKYKYVKDPILVKSKYESIIEASQK